MMETGLQTMARNLNHRNDNLLMFEFGKTYAKQNDQYVEDDHLALFSAGKVSETSWNKAEEQADLYYLKGVIQSLQVQSAIPSIEYKIEQRNRFEYCINGYASNMLIVSIGKPSAEMLNKFDIRVPVWFADIHWTLWLSAGNTKSIRYREISKFPLVQRDLSFVANNDVTFEDIERLISTLSIKQLKSYRLFDIFKSDKLGKNKQSMAMNFTFLDEEKTMKDDQVDKIMGKITKGIEETLKAEIRK
jgi:phenylalanyl-tRNA synthetase beta chain